MSPSHETSKSTPVNEPLQDRSRKTLSHLLDAARELLNERDVEEMTVADIAARASSSVGSFYARFASKDDIVRALLQQYERTLLDRLSKLRESDEWNAQGLGERVRRYLELGAEVGKPFRGVLRVRISRRVLATEADLERDAVAATELIQQVYGLFETASDEINHPDPRAALDFALRSISSVLIGTYFLHGTGFDRLSTEELFDRLTEMAVAYLHGRGREGRGG